MKPMTPEDARLILDGAKEHGGHLSIGYRRALETIAGMREEWGVHVTGYPKNIADWAELCDGPADHITWIADEEAAEDFAVEREDDGFDTRIIRRYVTEPESVE